MTRPADAVVLRELRHAPATRADLAYLTRMSHRYLHVVLTRLEAAGLVTRIGHVPRPNGGSGLLPILWGAK